MNDLDRTIRVALTPQLAEPLPAGLIDEIHATLAVTPQRGPGLVARLPRWIPALPVVSPLARRAVILVALGLALVVGVLLASVGLERGGAPLVQSYHGGGAQTGIMEGPAPAAIPEIVHRLDLGGPMDALSMPVARNGVAMFVSKVGIATAIDIATGAPRWRVEGLGVNSGGPAIVDHRLVIATERGEVIALDAEDGSEVWRSSIGRSAVAPLNAADGLVLIGTETGLVAVDGRDGRVRWTSEIGTILRSPPVADGVVYLAAEGGHLSAVELASGIERWTAEAGAGEISTGAVSDGRLFLIVGPNDETSPHELVALDVADGRETGRWTAPTNERMFTAAVVGQTVYTTAEDGVIRRIDTATESTMQPVLDAGSPSGTLITVVDGTMFTTADDGSVRAFDPETGAVLWTVVAPGLPTMAVVVEGRVLVGTDFGAGIVIGVPTP